MAPWPEPPEAVVKMAEAADTTGSCILNVAVPLAGIYMLIKPVPASNRPITDI